MHSRQSEAQQGRGSNLRSGFRASSPGRGGHVAGHVDQPGSAPRAGAWRGSDLVRGFPRVSGSGPWLLSA